MNALYDQIQVYLNMDEEISFEEFQDYYKKVMKKLEENANQLSEDGVWKALFVTETLMSNAEHREHTAKKKAEAKKFHKMKHRTQLYAEHFTKRLNELGYNEEDIGRVFEEMLEEGSHSD
ncbi:hypothetical protein ACFPTR_10285 [Aliibacillus thermotolerans]|uniref:Regulatory protein RecX n=1 Tax=Aliibacillus thermotolerans TaxID=1834418 RepID=A0ABW0UBA0_9BACI|nr:hypothetical protein [Aliibacillus thermotolerans]MDA3131160.1 hypothetical protein [Aliibacillus thermotolerans]